MDGLAGMGAELPAAFDLACNKTKETQILWPAGPLTAICIRVVTEHVRLPDSLRQQPQMGVPRRANPGIPV
jgi:hypothetical protein